MGEVEADPNITVHKSTTVAKTSGAPGEFAVELQNGGSSSQLTVGSVILASGWKPYEAEKLTHLGYGSSPDVITNIQMEEMVSNGGIKRPSDGKPPGSVAFIQCAGSRDQDHLPYCSSVCCRVSLKQAKYVREQHPGAKVFVIYQHLRSPAQYERFYANVQEDEGIMLTKGDIASVAPDGGQIAVEVQETLLGEDIKVKAGVYKDQTDRGYDQVSYTYQFNSRFCCDRRSEEYLFNRGTARYTGDDLWDLWTNVFTDPERIGMAGNVDAEGVADNQVIWYLQPLGIDVDYAGEQDIRAFYAMVDLPLSPNWTLTAGGTLISGGVERLRLRARVSSP